MACYHPVRAYQTADGEVLFSELKGYDFVKTLELPCGHCIGCRLERAREWSIRCVHESKLHEQNCFVTLTYSDANVPQDWSLNYRHFQGFMRRLRRHVKRNVRFYMCGEYGEMFSRPHYHACLFGYDFPDKKLLSRKGGHELYTSALLDRLWTFGMCSVGSVTVASAGYIARYVVKKITGDRADEHYQGRTPEFNRMSLKPGIGFEWFARYFKDWYPAGEVVVNGKKQMAPRYYDRLYSRCDPDGYERLQWNRDKAGRERSWDNTDERLRTREKVTKARHKFHEEK